ncbi:MAG: hypothetical protein AB7O97_00975 [Planctomycetota bacterium]
MPFVSPLQSTLPARILFALTAGLAHAQDDAVRVTWRDAPIPLEREEQAPTQTLRVVDGITGAPIAGAEVFRLDEPEFPLGGVFAFAERAVTDADGFAVLPRTGHWVMARAAGYGPGMDMGEHDRVFALAPGLDVPVRTVDWRGVPLAGYQVGWCGGCGHTPDLQNAVTDADGLATLSCIDPGNGISDLYLTGGPIAFEYDSVRWRPGDPPDVHRFGPGSVLHGIVLDHDGKPAAGAIVGTNARHRGPWALAGADGRFLVGGMSAGESFVIAHGGRKVEVPWPQQVPCELRLPAPDGEPWQEYRRRPEEPLGRLRVRVVDDGGSERPDAEVRLRGPLPRAERWRGATHGEIDVPGGRYDVAVTHPDWYDVRGQIDVVANDLVQIDLQAQQVPRVTLRIEGLPADGEALLVTARDGERREQVAWSGGAAREVAVDLGRDYAVVLQADADERRIPVAAAVLLAEAPPVFRYFDDTLLRARVLDERGMPADADASLVQHLPCRDIDGRPEPGFDPRDLDTAPCPDGALELRVRHAGAAWLWVRPRRADLRPRMVPIALPTRGVGVQVDLGHIELTSAPQLRLLLPDGAPLRGGVALLRTGVANFREHSFEVVRLGDDGSWIGPDLQPGQCVLVPDNLPAVVEHAGGDAGAAPTVVLPFRVPIGDAMPGDVRLPGGALHLHLHAEDGAPLDGCTVVLGDQLWPASGGLRIAQVPAGTHRLFVGREGHRTAVVSVTLTENTERDVRIALPRR